MNIKDMEAFSKAFAPVIKDFVDAAFSKFSVNLESTINEKFASQISDLSEQLSAAKKDFDAAIKTLSEVPVPKDGADFPEDKASEILESLAKARFDSIQASFDELSASAQKQISEAVEAIPIPKDGADYPEEKALEALSSLVGEECEGVYSKFEDMSKILTDRLEVAIEDIQTPADGKDFPEEQAFAKLEELAQEKLNPLIEQAEKLQTELKTFFETSSDEIEASLNSSNEKLSEAIKSIPIPKDGENFPEDKATEILTGLVKDQVETIRLEFKNIEEANVEFLTESKSKIDDAIKSIPIPKDGISVDELKIKDFINETVASIPAPRVPKDGEDGRDSLQLEVLPQIELGKSYVRGTYAKHQGGLWRAFERTLELRGWECIVNGVAGVEIKSEGPREFSMCGQLSDGTEFVKSFKLPIMLYKGVYSEKGIYDEGDSVTFGGCVWYSNVGENKSKPGTNEDWRLAVKKGRDYKEPVKNTPVDKTKGVKI